MFCTEGVPSQAASNILKGFKPNYESTVSGKLRDAGSVMLGKLNLDQFAMGSSTENSAFGVTKNPWDLTRVAGGSSGGSAAAVAAKFCDAALGSDTGGSIRGPASFCGVVGYKPSFGLYPSAGVFPLSGTLDHVGLFATSTDDVAAVHRALGFPSKPSALPKRIGVARADVEHQQRVGRVGRPGHGERRDHVAGAVR